MTTIPQPKAPASGYTATYDAWNRLVSLNSGSDVQVNQYDGLHRRIVRDETGGSGDKRHFYYNENWQCLEERVEVSGTINQYPIKQYTYFPHYIDAVSMVLYDPDTDGASIARYHYLHDANFNVVAMTDTSWNVKERYTYSPYGEVTILNGVSDGDGAEWSVDTNGSDMANEFLYTGRRLDPGTGLYYYRNRYYHAQLGRFVTRDPIEFSSREFNLYAYVGQNPTGKLDPYGEEEVVATSAPPCDPNDPVPNEINVTAINRDFKEERRECNYVNKIKPAPEVYCDAKCLRDILQGKIKTECDCIKSLEVYSHSSPNWMQGLTCPNNYAQTAPSTDIRFLDEQFVKYCDDCVIYLNGCNTGLGGSTGIAQQIANDTGCTVMGSKGYLSGCHYGGNETCTKSCVYNGHEYTAYPGSVDAKGDDCWKEFKPLFKVQ